jgi:hypothetical protein
VDGKGGWTSFELQGVGSFPLVQRSLSLLMGGSSGAILQLVCSVAAFSVVLFLAAYQLLCCVGAKSN